MRDIERTPHQRAITIRLLTEWGIPFRVAVMRPPGARYATRPMFGLVGGGARLAASGCEDRAEQVGFADGKRGARLVSRTNTDDPVALSVEALAERTLEIGQVLGVEDDQICKRYPTEVGQ